MASKCEIRVAKEIIRKRQGEFGKRRKRIHEDTLERYNLKRRALEGICGNCRKLEVDNHPDGYLQGQVIIRCTAGRDPVAKYRNTKLGNTPECEDKRPR